MTPGGSVIVSARSALTCLALAAAALAPLSAQRPPGRPRLGADADTNDARAYTQWALQRVENDPRRASDAFYWAARLDPLAAPAFYGRYAALLLIDTRQLVPYVQREERTLTAPAVLALDSILFRGEMRDPFVHRGLDELLLFTYAQAGRPRDEWFGRSEIGGESGMWRRTEEYFETGDPYSRGRLYYSRGLLAEALRYWSDALRTSDLDWVHAERARAWHELNRLDSTAGELRSALERARRGGSGYHHPFESVAAWETALGRVLEARGDVPAAREAYERAVLIDANYFPARLQLAQLTLAARDTPTTIMHLEQATQSAAADYYAFFTAGVLAGRAGQRSLALSWLRRATDLEPWAASGWYAYAQALESAPDTGAVSAYTRFLAVAAHDDSRRAIATQRLEQHR